MQTLGFAYLRKDVQQNNVQYNDYLEAISDELQDVKS